MKQLMARLFALSLVVLILTGCGMDATPFAPIPTVGPALSLVDSATCLNASDGPITIWHKGTENTPLYTCAPKVIVSLEFSDARAIAYDGNIIPLDDVYTLVDGAGYVYTKQELLDGKWPDTIGPAEESHNLRSPL